MRSSTSAGTEPGPNASTASWKTLCSCGVQRTCALRKARACGVNVMVLQ